LPSAADEIARNQTGPSRPRPARDHPGIYQPGRHVGRDEARSPRPLACQYVPHRRAAQRQGRLAEGAQRQYRPRHADRPTVLGILGVFAEFETNIGRERQLECIAKAKVIGVYKGRPATIDAEKVQQLKSEGMGATEIARTVGASRASVYRLLG
jgi:hypothetical protein